MVLTLSVLIRNTVDCLDPAVGTCCIKSCNWNYLMPGICSASLKLCDQTAFDRSYVKLHRADEETRKSIFEIKHLSQTKCFGNTQMCSEAMQYALQ